MDSFWKGSLFESLYVEELVLDEDPFAIGKWVRVKASTYHYIRNNAIAQIINTPSTIEGTSYEVQAAFPIHTQFIHSQDITPCAAPASTSTTQAAQDPDPGTTASTSELQVGDEVRVDNKHYIMSYSDTGVVVYVSKYHVRVKVVQYREGGRESYHTLSYDHSLVTKIERAVPVLYFSRGEKVYVTNLGKDTLIWDYDSIGTIIEYSVCHDMWLVQLYSEGDMDEERIVYYFNEKYLTKV